MNRLLSFLLTLSITATITFSVIGIARAQDVGSLHASARQPITIEAVGNYQAFITDQGLITQSATPLRIGIPLARHTRVRLVGGRASVEGDGLTPVSGMTNLQIGLAQAIMLGDFGTLQLGVNAGFPTGTTGFTSAEFATAIRLSRSEYRFAQPGFGQGRSVHPHVALAVNVARGVVLGAGFTFGYRAAFDPTVRLLDYDPGDEMLVTAGLSIALSRVTYLAIDATMTTYGADRLSGDTVIEAGTRTGLLVQVRRRKGRNDFRIQGRYRSQETSLFRGVLSPEITPPTMMEATLYYAAGVSRYFSVATSLSAMRLTEVGCEVGSIVCLEEQTLGRMVIEPVISLGRPLDLIFRVGVVLGTTIGAEGGFGIRVRV